MGTTTTSVDVQERVAAIESAFVAHWSMFGQYPGASLFEEDGVLGFEGPIAHLPYNAVIRTTIPDDVDPDSVIRRVVERFRARDVPFMWVHRPGDRPTDLGHRLGSSGLDLVETATGMDLDLDGWTADVLPAGVRIVEASSDAELADYEALIRTYWSVPDDQRHWITTLNRHWTGERSPGARLVAYIDDAAVGKLFLNLTQVPVASVYGVAVTPAARGRGIATGLMTEALTRARDAGCDRIVLHSSAMARSLYERMGFVERCTIDAYATGPLFGTHHH